MSGTEKVRELLRDGVRCVEDERCGSPGERASLRSDYEQALAELDALEELAGPLGHDALHGSAAHRLHVEEGEWGLVHPFRCRPDLTGCPVHRAASAQMRSDPIAPGVYEVGVSDEGDLTVIADLPGGA